jgi:ribonuclease HI
MSLYDESNCIYIFCSGYAQGNLLRPVSLAGWTSILKINDKHHIMFGCIKDSSANDAALYALNQMLEKMHTNPSRIVVVSDSNYLISGASSWINGWSNNNWCNQKGKEISHSDFWRDFYLLRQGFPQLSFVWHNSKIEEAWVKAAMFGAKQQSTRMEKQG